MSRAAFAVLALILAGCASAPAKPAAPIAAAPAAPPCPLYIVDGEVQPSSCAAAKKSDSAKCDAKGPMYVVDGVVVGCVDPEAGR